MVRLLAILPLLLAAAPVRAQDGVDELKKEIEGLKRKLAELQEERDRLTRDNDGLRRDIQGLRTVSEENARELIDLRQRLRDSGGIVPAKPQVPEPAAGAPPSQGEPEGPTQVLAAEIIYVDPQEGFVLINKGEKEGVRPGYRFDIQRRERTGSGPTDFKYRVLATAEFEKYMGESKSQSKLRIVSGQALEIKGKDEAVAQRRVESAPAKPGDVPPAPGDMKFKITGRAGTKWVINHGAKSNARQTDRVFVYRDKVKRAEMRIDVVDKDWCVAEVIDGTLAPGTELQEGDEVLLKEVRNPIVGRVKWNDSRHGLMIDAGIRNGVKAGMQFEVRRQGRKIGVIMVKKTLDYVSECDKTGELRLEDILVDDFVESIE